MFVNKGYYWIEEVNIYMQPKYAYGSFGVFGVVGVFGVKMVF